MRVIIDTNVFISFLLGENLLSPPVNVVIAGIRGDFAILCSELLIAELKRKVAEKAALASRIPQHEVDVLVGSLRSQAEFVTGEFSAFPKITRNPADDFLIAHAVLGEADYIVSGDKDLLVLGEFGGVRIVSPAELVRILDL